MQDPESSPESPRSRPSQIPSWIMLGFILGALFVLALPSRTPAPPPVPAAPAEIPSIEAARPIRKANLTTIEAVFAEWGRYAVWENDATEVALWNAEAGGFSDCYEVIRSGEDAYFRSIPRLSRPVLVTAAPSKCPLQFTESEEHREARLKGEEDEVFKNLGGGR